MFTSGCDDLRSKLIPLAGGVVKISAVDLKRGNDQNLEDVTSVVENQSIHDSLRRETIEQ